MVTLLHHAFREFAPAESIGPAEWPHLDLFFVHRGEVTLALPSAGNEVRLKRGQGALIFPHTSFAGRVGAGGAQASVQHFTAQAGAWPPFDALVGRAHGYRVTGADERRLATDVARAVRAATLAGGGSRPGVALALLAVILAESGVVDPPAIAPLRLEHTRLTQQLAAHDWQTPGVAALAAANGLSPSRFRVVFQQEHGGTAGDFVRRWRAAEAQRLLRETTLPTKAIAARLGFADVVSFHRSFVRQVGETPGCYRRHHPAAV